jgi:hypothetical protein
LGNNREKLSCCRVLNEKSSGRGKTQQIPEEKLLRLHPPVSTFFTPFVKHRSCEGEYLPLSGGMAGQLDCLSRIIRVIRGPDSRVLIAVEKPM